MTQNQNENLKNMLAEVRTQFICEDIYIQSLDNMLRILSTSTNLNEKELELVNACRKHVEDLEFKYKNRSELLYRFAKQLHDIKL